VQQQIQHLLTAWSEKETDINVDLKAGSQKKAYLLMRVTISRLKANASTNKTFANRTERLWSSDVLCWAQSPPKPGPTARLEVGFG
jgi:hypothetical protein